MIQTHIWRLLVQITWIFEEKKTIHPKNEEK